MPDPRSAIPDSPQPPAVYAYATSAEKLRAMWLPETYDEPTRGVDLIETHFAWVFLTDAHVYKLKKPVTAPGLELLSPAQRHANCCEELRLNRVLAPDVYLGLLPLVRRADGALKVGGDGDIVDCVIKMRRLPATLMLDQAIATGTVPLAPLDAVGRLLVDFYRQQPPVDMAPQAYVQRIADQIEANRIALLAPDLGLDPWGVEQLVTVQRATLARLRGQLADRALQRRIVEGHGDLRPEHVCLATPPCIIDRLEFSFDLRVLDPCEELAYLCIECAHAGAAWVGERLFNLYRDAAADPVSMELFHLYSSHRAATRAKLVAWHLRDPEFRTRGPWTAIAKRYLEVALQHLQPFVPV